MKISILHIYIFIIICGVCKFNSTASTLTPSRSQNYIVFERIEYKHIKSLMWSTLYIHIFYDRRQYKITIDI